jgi:biotin carboxyl carrier protein
VKLHLTINGSEAEVELLEPGPACRFSLDGAIREADVEMPEPGVYSVLLEGRSYEARVERTARETVVVIDGYRFEIQIRDPRRWSRQSGSRHGEGAETLAAPMPGKVIRILAAAGDTVAAGQGILVVEAMKMQNELKATRAGRVAAVHAREGATVTAGEELVTIEALG